MIAINISTPKEVAMQLAARVRARRLELDLTQQGIAERSGLKFATYRRFEQTGEISLRHLLQIGLALDMLADFNELFNRRQYQSLDEILQEQEFSRKRGHRQ